ncbi:sce7725 family protein [Hymenobacter coccineus]|uniref:Sce7725 family protein n=1 Tax=Hymenobacter coccineus TaxID=1908235 RepID=A0A1G1TKU8_9BACT|nr:sce7725 family protein [Hymenobacter coccineus]OGX91497.1 hypothetical protein BEN49_04810 [Hymenobacter coccineus]
MYFPYLRAKEFELKTILGLPPHVFERALPIVEPINLNKLKLYKQIAVENRPLILVTNPTQGKDRPSGSEVQKFLVEEALASHNHLILAHVITNKLHVGAVQSFLTANPFHGKALIFQHLPLLTDLHTIDQLLRKHSEVKYIVFDLSYAHELLSSPVAWHPGKVLIQDGFQAEDRNSEYPPKSKFASPFATWSKSGFAGYGDYLINGRKYTDGGGRVKVVALHLTEPPVGSEVVMHHFKSTSLADVSGLAPTKFKEACAALVTAPATSKMKPTSGLSMYANWHLKDFFPQLGAAKQASMQHHIEVMAKLVP